MSEPPYTPLTGKIEEYFSRIREVGIPEKIDRDWLRSIGFSSGNDYYLVGILKFLNFVSDQNEPTEIWRKYRSPLDNAKVLGLAIKQAYSDLFNLYNNADQRSREELMSYFKVKSDKADSTIQLMVNTFQNLCSLAEFTDLDKIQSDVQTPNKKEDDIVYKSRSIIPNINININLSEMDDVSLYKEILKTVKEVFLDEDDNPS